MAMFKKFTDLLFEDEVEDDEYEEDQETVETVKDIKHEEKPVKKGKGFLRFDDDEDDEDDEIEKFITESSKKEPTPVAPVENEATKVLPVVKEIKPTATVEAKPEVKTEPKLGITVDELVEKKEEIKVEEVKPAVAKVTPARTLPTIEEITHPKKAKPVVNRSNSYEFAPVISPMFGVSDKEMDNFNEQFDASASYENTNRFDEVEGDEAQVEFSKVISPMYGTFVKVNKPEPVVQPEVTLDKPVEEETESVIESEVETTSSNEVAYQSLDDLINEGRHAANSSDLEKTRAFRFDDLLKEDSNEKTVESVYANVNLFNQEESDHE